MSKTPNAFDRLIIGRDKHQLHSKERDDVDNPEEKIQKCITIIQGQLGTYFQKKCNL